jgi:hypothetical protein
MTVRTFAAISIGLMLLGRVADTLVTWHFSPTLELEANPLASVFKLGWPSLLAANLMVVAGIVSCSVLWCVRPTRYERSPEVHDLWSFASFACYGRVYPPLAFLRRRLFVPPTRRGHILCFIGAVMPVTVAVVSGLAVLSWHAVYGNEWPGFSQLYSLLWPCFPYAVVIPTLWIASLFFYHFEFRRYKASC